jgi:hypothetical protein
MARSKRGDANKTRDASRLGSGEDMRCAGNIPLSKPAASAHYQREDGIGAFNTR